jgi:hypothetical protein
LKSPKNPQKSRFFGMQRKASSAQRPRKLAKRVSAKTYLQVTS